ncbi:hypothetical protein EDC04DRAFT_2716298 [Pisolithus marmoratus]|nr:hypothetical protein EDC04DRAFT_2716298 [Pisolithus marmoratus]
MTCICAWLFGSEHFGILLLLGVASIFNTLLSLGHTLLCCQLPLTPTYATTFNSCQGLTLDCVGVDLTKPVFSHGQLYTAFSCICHRNHAHILLPANNNTTTNVTFHKLLL